MLVKALVNIPVFVEVELQDDLSPAAIREVVRNHAIDNIDDAEVLRPIITELEVMEDGY
jgi:hypothetical protein